MYSGYSLRISWTRRLGPQEQRPCGVGTPVTVKGKLSACSLGRTAPEALDRPSRTTSHQESFRPSAASAAFRVLRPPPIPSRRCRAAAMLSWSSRNESFWQPGTYGRASERTRLGSRSVDDLTISCHVLPSSPRRERALNFRSTISDVWPNSSGPRRRVQRVSLTFSPRTGPGAA